MFKVHREQLTTTSERKSGFNSAEDDFDLDDMTRSNKYSQRFSKGKDFRSTDEENDLENWNSNLLTSNHNNKHNNLLSGTSSSSTNYNNNTHFNNSTNTQYSATNHQSANQSNHLATNINYNNTATRQSSGNRKDGLCSCCPHGYHVDLDYLKTLNADEYENIAKDPKYLVKHHRRLHDMQQQQFQQRNNLTTQSALNLHSSRPLSPQHPLQHPQQHPQQHSQQQQPSHMVQSPPQSRFSASTSNLQKQQLHASQQQQHINQLHHQQTQQQQHKSQHQTNHQTHQSNHHQQQQHQQTQHHQQQQKHQQNNTDNALMLYGRASSANTTLNNSRKHSADFHLSNGNHPGNDVNRKETVVVNEDGSTTTKVIEEVHRTRTTIIDLDSDPEEPEKAEKKPINRRPIPQSPVKPVDDKVSQRQRQLEQLQQKLQRIQPVNQRGPLKTYVNAADPKSVEEKDEPSFEPPVRRPFPDPPQQKKIPHVARAPEEDPTWPREREELMKKINELQKVNSAKKPTREMGVGDKRVDEEEARQVVGVVGQAPVRVHEKELNTEETTEIREKEIKTIFVSGIDDKFNLASTNKPAVLKAQTSQSTKESKNFGVGDGDVFDDGRKNFEIHEKELRTVYLAGPDKPTTRNVGILCKSAMRDVGMVHNSEDEKPLMRNVAVGVGEVGISESDGAEMRMVQSNLQGTTGDVGGSGGGDESYFATSGFSHTSLTSMKGGMGGLRGDQLKAYLDEHLKREVHSVASQCQFSSVNKGTDAARVGYELHNVACSDDTVDVEVRPIREMKSVAIDNRPSLFHRCVGTDIIYKLDVGTNTRPQGLFASTHTNTDPKSVSTTFTMTEQPRMYSQQTGTELGIFYDLNQIKNNSSMTDDVDMFNKRVNTETQVEHRIDSSSQYGASSTASSSGVKEVRRDEEQATGYRKYIEETVSPGYLVSYTKTTRNRSRPERSPGRHTTTTSSRENRGGSSSTHTTSHNRSSSAQDSFSTADKTHQLLGLDRVSDTKKISDTDGRTRVVTLSRGPGYTETITKENFSSKEGGVGVPLVPGLAGFPDQYFSKRAGNDEQSSMSSSTYSKSSGHKGGPYYSEKTTHVGGGGSRLGETLGDSTSYIQTVDDGQQYITEVQCPGYKTSKILVETDSGLIEGGGQMVGGGQVVGGGSGVSGSGGSFEVQFSGGGGGGGMGSAGDGSMVKSQTSTQRKSFASSSSSSSSSGGTKGSSVVRLGGIGEEGFHDASDYNSMKGADGKLGVKTVIKESYGANNIKIIVTEEIEISTGKVLSSTTTQGHYDSLPTFHSSSSSSRGFAKSAFNFAKSGITAEKFTPDAELSSACQVYSNWLTNKSNVKQNQLDSSKAVLHKRWFHTAGSRESSVYLVEGLMTYLNHLSPDLLKHVVNFSDDNNNTVLHYAVSYARMDVAACVLSCGFCDLDKQNDVGYTVAMLVCITITTDPHHLPFVKAIFEASNLNIKSSDSSAQTALMMATGHQKDKMVEMMVSMCDINVRNSHGSTALMIAAFRGDYDIVKMLLSNTDCDVYAMDKEGKTALSIAKDCKHEFVVSQIQEEIKERSRK